MQPYLSRGEKCNTLADQIYVDIPKQASVKRQKKEENNKTKQQANRKICQNLKKKQKRKRLYTVYLQNVLVFPLSCLFDCFIYYSVRGHAVFGLMRSLF